MSDQVRIVLVILEDTHGRVALQLRSPLANIANPDHWGLFGGHVDPGEDDAAAARREAEEELTCLLNSAKMRYLRNLDRLAAKIYLVFHYKVNKELDGAQLTEGERWGFFSPAQIMLGSIEGKPIVPHHLELLKDFWANPIAS